MIKYVNINGYLLFIRSIFGVEKSWPVGKNEDGFMSASVSSILFLKNDIKLFDKTPLWLFVALRNYSTPSMCG